MSPRRIQSNAVGGVPFWTVKGLTVRVCSVVVGCTFCVLGERYNQFIQLAVISSRVR